MKNCLFIHSINIMNCCIYIAKYHYLMQRKPPKGKDQASGSGDKKPAAQTASQSAAHVDVDQSQVSMVVDGTQPSVDASQNDVAASQPLNDAPSRVVVTQPTVAANQPSDVAVTQPSDLFDEIPDDVMASIPEIAEVLSTKPDDKKLKKVKIEKVKSAKENSVKLYHGQKVRSSERIKSQNFSKPISGVGSSKTQPIVIAEAGGDDQTKLGTCVRNMKSWKNLSKKN
jgi:hypothetical protein